MGKRSTHLLQPMSTARNSSTSGPGDNFEYIALGEQVGQVGQVAQAALQYAVPIYAAHANGGWPTPL